MNWRLSPAIDIGGAARIPAADARRQAKTAAEILRRFDNQPGVVLADEVGMGKTYVALATAVSVLEATDRRRPVVVMVPPSVQREVASGMGGLHRPVPGEGCWLSSHRAHGSQWR